MGGKSTRWLRSAAGRAKRAAVGKAPAGFVQRAKQFTRPKVRSHGTLSVIIPVYNVENYLAECLDSIISQDYADLQIIVIDDGSTDGSAQIVNEFARRDKRITLLRQEHAGNGRARNFGIERACGDFLTFADGDDVVAQGAYAALVQSLACTGSDFAVGSYDRLRGKKTEPVKLAQRVHHQELAGIDLASFPEASADVFLWNKVYRREFWNTHVGPMPEGVSYEDQLPTLKGFIAADRFDVLQSVVYHWRIRSDGSSLTQDKLSIKDLSDRLLAMKQVTELAVQSGEPGLAEGVYVRALGTDLWPYFEASAQAELAYWPVLVAGVRELLTALSTHSLLQAKVFRALEPHSRAMLFLVQHDRQDDLETAIVDRFNYGSGSVVEVSNGHWRAIPRYLDEISGLNEQLDCSVQPEQLTFQTELRWLSPGNGTELQLVGTAYVLGLDSTRYPGDLRVELKTGGEWTEIASDRYRNEWIDATADDSFASHNAAAFRVSNSNVSDDAADYRVSLEVEGHTFSQIVSVPETPQAQMASTHAPRAVGFRMNHDEQTLAVTVRGRNLRKLVFKLSTQSYALNLLSCTPSGEDQLEMIFSLQYTLWSWSMPAPPAGAYTLRWGLLGERLRSVQTDALFQTTLPVHAAFDTAAVRAWATLAGAFAVTIAEPLESGEQGRYNQAQLHKIFHGPQLKQYEQAVVFETFNGESTFDNPGALSEELHGQEPERKIFWSIKDFSVPYPQYAQPMVRGSKLWHEVVHSAGTLVNNNNFPHYFRKAEGQFYLQTWHGTPIKKIGLDTPKTSQNFAYISILKAESKSWDLLLAPQGHGGDLLIKAFCFNGPTLRVNAPRNDALQKASRTQVARALSAFGIEGNRVLLYAPTWEVQPGVGNAAFIRDFLKESSQLAEHLPSDFVVLARAHHNCVPIRGEIPEGVLDVSAYPDINDLMLIADYLVTDYSSILFDYREVSGTIVLYQPNIDSYSERPGFYGGTMRLARQTCKLTLSTLRDIRKVATSAVHETEMSQSENRPKYFSVNASASKKVLAAAKICNGQSTSMDQDVDKKWKLGYKGD